MEVMCTKEGRKVEKGGGLKGQEGSKEGGGRKVK
jgi:hypothetical protein